MWNWKYKKASPTWIRVNLFIGFPWLRSVATWVNPPLKRRSSWKRWRTANDFIGGVMWFRDFIYCCEWFYVRQSKQKYASKSLQRKGNFVFLGQCSLGQTQTFTNREVAWFAHIGCNGVVRMSLAIMWQGGQLRSQRGTLQWFALKHQDLTGMYCLC